MRIPWGIRKVAYNLTLLKVLDYFKVKQVFKKAYFYIILPKNKTLSLFCSGIAAKFHLDTPEKLIQIEKCLLDKNQKEVSVIDKIVNMLGAGDVFYDVGANLGMYTIFMAKKVGEKGCVVAFEPELSNYKVLQKNILINELNNIILFQYALGNVEKIGCLYNDMDTSKSSLVQYRPQVPVSQSVKIISGDNLILGNNIPLPKVIKIDVEGYEYFVIRGLEKILKQECCKIVFCEIHPEILPEGLTCDDIISLLGSFGFSKYEIYNRGMTLHAFFFKDAL